MPVTLSLQSSPSDLFSSEGGFTSPLNFTFDGVSGGTKEVNLLLTNTGSSSISITGIQIDGSSPSVTSVYFKLDGVSSYTANAITSPPLALASNAQQSFWMQVIVPNGTSVANVKNLELEVTYT